MLQKINLFSSSAQHVSVLLLCTRTRMQAGPSLGPEGNSVACPKNEATGNLPLGRSSGLLPGRSCRRFSGRVLLLAILFRPTPVPNVWRRHAHPRSTLPRGCEHDARAAEAEQSPRHDCSSERSGSSGRRPTSWTASSAVLQQQLPNPKIQVFGPSSGE